MRSRRRSSDREEEDEEDEFDEDEEEEEEPRARPHRRGSRSGTGPEPVRPWSGEEEEPETDRGWFGRSKKPVFWRARDSLWFEPLVALAIVILLIVGLYTYTQNWPPVYVVESMSMQHGDNDQLGLINTGDLVLAQKVDTSSVTPYMVGLQNGFSTYGEYGDVLLYHPNGDASVSPIIHRAILFLQHNPDDTWSVPDLTPLVCTLTSHPYYSISTTSDHCGTNHIMGTLTLVHVGWQSVNVTIPLAAMGDQSGFVTMGDNNYIPGHPAQGEIDQSSGISALVQEGWIVGVARGMIPWFGAFKLLLSGQAGEVPPQSWQLMGLTIAAVLLGALGVHVALRAREEARQRGPDDEEAGPGGFRDRMRHLFRRRKEDDEEEDPSSEAGSRNGHRKVKPVSKEKILRRRHGSGGRPRPAVRRNSSSKDSKVNSEQDL
jgi:signal peptidase